MNVILNRLADDGYQTTGSLFVLDDKGDLIFSCYTLELPWLDNKNNISCIPLGNYGVSKRNADESTKYNYEHFILDGTCSRVAILIHAGNYKKDTHGCILVGEKLIDIDKDGHSDVTNSRATLNKLLDILPDKFNIEIR